MAAAISSLAAVSADRREAMGAASRQMVEQRFGENVVIAAYLDALGKLTGARS